MPIINIKTLPLDGTIDTAAILVRLIEQLTLEIEYKAEEIWATWEFLPADNYAVGEEVSSTQTNASHPPLIRILAFEGKSPEMIERMIKKVAHLVSEELHIDIKNIFIEFHEAHSR